MSASDETYATISTALHATAKRVHDIGQREKGMARDEELGRVMTTLALTCVQTADTLATSIALTTVLECLGLEVEA